MSFAELYAADTKTYPRSVTTGRRRRLAGDHDDLASSSLDSTPQLAGASGPKDDVDRRLRRFHQRERLRDQTAVIEATTYKSPSFDAGLPGRAHHVSERDVPRDDPRWRQHNIIFMF